MVTNYLHLEFKLQENLNINILYIIIGDRVHIKDHASRLAYVNEINELACKLLFPVLEMFCSK